MNDTCTSAATGRRGEVPFAAALLMAAALLAGCSSDYEKLSSQPYDTDYEVFSVLNRAGNLDIFLIKAYESDGMVALCGGYTRGTSSFSMMATRQWADISEIYIEDIKIGNAGFMTQMPVYGFKDGEDPKSMFLALQETGPSLPCVRSKVPWKTEFESAKVERRGATKLRVYD